MTDMEKKEFFRDFIKSIELCSEKPDNENTFETARFPERA